MAGERCTGVVRADRHAELEGDGGCDKSVLWHGGERDPEPPAIEVAERGRPCGQPRFSDAPTSGHGDQPRARQYLVKASQLVLAPHERGRDRWQPRRGPDHLATERRYVDLDCLSARIDAELVAEDQTALLEGPHRAGPIARAI